MDRRSFMATTGRATLAGGALAATGSLVSAPAADAAPAAEPRHSATATAGPCGSTSSATSRAT